MFFPDSDCVTQKYYHSNSANNILFNMLDVIRQGFYQYSKGTGKES